MQEGFDYNTLKSLTIFRELTKNEFDAVCKFIFIQKAAKDFFLFSQGMPGELLYIIISGRVEIIKKAKNNDKIVLATMGANDIVGELSLIDSEPRSATGRTTEDSVLLGITKESFKSMLETDPRIAAKILMSLLKIMSKRLRTTTNQKIEGSNS